ncbi:NSFL1 cofactor p47 [Hyalella azteca]|uniref:NSFL1 cofactor p47 n=1 Tax=Hyalella azteca TaxID=294128 RepID=A0A8B7NGK2_HYAAZ|nr:NSFL1 cofactor p47 [Hyalella azteca]
MSDHDELIQQFSAVSGADADRAKFFLESAEWNLSTALSSFFEETGEEDGAAGRDSASSALPSAVGGAAFKKPASTAEPKLKPASGGWSSNSDNSDEDDEDSHGQAFYAGGSEHSGQQVLGPPRKKHDMVAKLFKAAKEHGADVVEDSRSGARSVRTHFQGTSYRLGETMDDTQVFSASSSRNNQGPEPVELRMWRTGFTVGDGPLRSYDDDESRRFLKDIKNGHIPLELLKASGGREVAINMSDHHHEDYVAPKPVLRAFTGQGQALGSPAPTVMGQVSHVPGPGGSTHKPLGDPKQLEEDAKKALSVDATQPTTNVQVRLNDGSRLVIHANHSHTVGDLRTYLSVARPEYASLNYSLMTTFPHAELAQHDQTLAQAKLLNAAIVAKIK